MDIAAGGSLLGSISEFCRRTGMAESTFGRRAVSGWRQVRRAPARRCRPSGDPRPGQPVRSRAWRAWRRGRAAELLPLIRPGAVQRSRYRAPRSAARKELPASSTTARSTCCSSTPAARKTWWPPGRPRARPYPSAPARGAAVRRRHGRRHGARARDARDPPAFSDGAVLHRGQGDQPRGCAPQPAQDGRPLLRAPGHRPGGHEHVLHGGALAHAAGTVAAATSMVWHEVALTGTTSHDFSEQIAALEPFLVKNWQARQPEDRQSGVRASHRPGHLPRRLPLPAGRGDSAARAGPGGLRHGDRLAAVSPARSA